MEKVISSKKVFSKIHAKGQMKKSNNKIDLAELILNHLPYSYKINKEYKDGLYYSLKENIISLFKKNNFDLEDVDVTNRAKVGIELSLKGYPDYILSITSDLDYENNISSEIIRCVNESDNNPAFVIVSSSNGKIINYVNYDNSNNNIVDQYNIDIKNDNYAFKRTLNDEVIYDGNLLAMGIRSGETDKYMLETKIPDDKPKSFLQKVYKLTQDGDLIRIISKPKYEDLQVNNYDDSFYSNIFDDNLKKRANEELNKNIGNKVKRR